MIAKDTYEDVYDYLLRNNVLLLEDVYINKSTYMKMLCLKCGKIFKTTLSKFQEGRTCSKCKQEKRRKEMYLHIKYYASLYGCILNSKEYIDAHKKLSFTCPKGHPFDMNWNNFKSGKRCKKCADDELRHSYEYVKFYIESRGYKLLSKEYKDVRSKIKIQCPKGHIFNITFNNFRQGNRCGKCRRSIGEEEVSYYLDKFKIKYNHQHSFDDCKSINVLPFDFYLPNYNIIIEYDGKQHYNPTDFANKGKEWALDNFITCKIHDTIKNLYCKNNNIKIIRIPYWEFKNIEEILIRELNLNN